MDLALRVCSLNKVFLFVPLAEKKKKKGKSNLLGAQTTSLPLSCCCYLPSSLSFQFIMGSWLLLSPLSPILTSFHWDINIVSSLSGFFLPPFSEDMRSLPGSAAYCHSHSQPLPTGLPTSMVTLTFHCYNLPCPRSQSCRPAHSVLPPLSLGAGVESKTRRQERRGLFGVQTGSGCV